MAVVRRLLIARRVQSCCSARHAEPSSFSLNAQFRLALLCPLPYTAKGGTQARPQFGEFANYCLKRSQKET